MKEEFKNVQTVECRTSAEGFKLSCDVIHDFKKDKVEVYGYVATDPLATNREADKSWFSYGVGGKGVCVIRDYTRLDGSKEKILDCGRA